MFKILLLSASLFANTIGMNSIATKIEAPVVASEKQAEGKSLSNIIKYFPKLAPTPTLNNINNLAIRSDAYILFEPRSATVLVEKNGHTKRSYASTIKLLTALLAVEKGGLNEIVTVSHNAATQIGSTMALRENEQITITNLLYGLMLNSGNDSAMALAEWHSGTKEAFVLNMNKRARALGLSESVFADPAGLDEVNTLTTAYDLSKLLNYSFRNPVLANLLITKEMTVSDTSGKIKHVLQNSDKLLKNDYPGVLGGKTGTGTFGSYKESSGKIVLGAGHCIAVAAEQNDIRLVAVIGATYLNTHDASANEAQKLLDFGFQNITYTK